MSASQQDAGDDLSPGEMLAIASAFMVLPRDPYRQNPRIEMVQVTRTNAEPERWCIEDGSNRVLSQDNVWEWQPMPSMRDNAFLLQTRWPSARAAIAFARDHLRRYPTGHKPEVF